MISVEMEPVSVKAFMNRILREDILDQFEVRAAEMTIATRMTINGALEIHDSDEEIPQTPGYITWEALRPLLFAIIKTGAKPKLIKIVFSYKAAIAKDLHPNAAALFLNMTYENDAVSFTTATAQREFALDKSLDDTWDNWTRSFFMENSIIVTDRE
ncbi:MAG: DUF5721 family protein [Defluviitaleaceae bacterium]|nr:DUF5721 family protein [Defluviitaleaceae bacterium]